MPRRGETSGAGVPGLQADVAVYTYRNNGAVETFADAKNNLTTYEYDGFDRRVKTRFPSQSTPGMSSSTDYEQVLVYDANSNATSSRQRGGQIIAFAFDNLNRPAVKDIPSTTTEDVYYEYDNLGRLKAARYGNTTGAGILNSFDALGRQLTRSVFGRNMTYEYDPAGKRTRVTHPDGFYAQYNFDTAGQIDTIVDSSGVTLANYDHDDLGRRADLLRGNGTSSSWAYDALSRLQSLTQNPSGTAYDSMTTFGYTPSSQMGSRTQSNDAYTWVPPGTGTTSYIVNGLNQVTQAGGIGVSHDSNGNITNSGAWTFVYDPENRLRTASSTGNSVTLQYDPLGMLSQVTPSMGTDTQFLYDGDDLIAEYTPGGTLLRRYVHGVGVDEPLVWYEGSSTADRRYLHSDERGSIVAVSDNSGAVNATYAYSPFGEWSAADGSRFKYGQIAISEIGLYYYKARFYSAKLGRFMQPDPIGYGDGPNLYAYVGHDPVNATDPSGMDCYYAESAPTFGPSSICIYGIGSGPSLSSANLDMRVTYGQMFHYDQIVSRGRQVRRDPPGIPFHEWAENDTASFNKKILDSYNAAMKGVNFDGALSSLRFIRILVHPGAFEDHAVGELVGHDVGQIQIAGINEGYDLSTNSSVMWHELMHIRYRVLGSKISGAQEHKEIYENQWRLHLTSPAFRITNIDLLNDILGNCQKVSTYCK